MNAPLPVAAARYDLAEIAKAIGVHKSNVARRANKESWSFEDAPVRGGKKRFYPVATLPADIKTAILQAHLRKNVVSSAVSVDADALPAALPVAGSFISASLALPVEHHHAKTTRQREAETARRVILGRLAQLQLVAGCSQEAALTTMLTNARNTGDLAQTLALARDSRGRKGAHDDGLPSVRSLKRWLSKKANGADLAPAIPQQDWSVKPWHGAAITLMQRPQGSIKLWVHEQLLKGWQPHWGAPISYDTLTRFFRERASQIDLVDGRHTGMDFKAHKRYRRRTKVGLWPAQEVHADGWCTHFTAPHPVSGEYVTYEVWTAVDFATNYPCTPAFGLTESYEVIAKCLENFVRELGVPMVWQIDNTKSAKNDRFELDSVASLQARLGMTVVHPSIITKGKGNSQANGLVEKIHAWYDQQARELGTYQGKAMDSLTLKRVKRITAKMAKAVDVAERAALKREAERTGKGIVFDSYEAAITWMVDKVEKYRDTPNRGLPKIRDAETGSLRHQTPREALAQAKNEGWEPVVMTDPEIADAFRPHVRKTIKRGGVWAYSGHRFDHEELEAWNNKEVMVAIDLHDYQRVWVKTLEGRLICEAALVESRLPRPKSFYELAEAKRRETQIKRREQQIDAIEARDSSKILEAPKMPWYVSPVLEPGRQYIDAEYETVTDAAAPNMPENVTRLPGTEPRPLFYTDHDQYRWLMAHRAAWNADDARWLLDYTESDDYADIAERYAFQGVAWNDDAEQRAKHLSVVAVEAAAR